MRRVAAAASAAGASAYVAYQRRQRPLHIAWDLDETLICSIHPLRRAKGATLATPSERSPTPIRTSSRADQSRRAAETRSRSRAEACCRQGARGQAADHGEARARRRRRQLRDRDLADEHDHGRGTRRQRREGGARPESGHVGQCGAPPSRGDQVIKLNGKKSIFSHDTLAHLQTPKLPLHLYCKVPCKAANQMQARWLLAVATFAVRPPGINAETRDKTRCGCCGAHLLLGAARKGDESHEQVPDGGPRVCTALLEHLLALLFVRIGLRPYSGPRSCIGVALVAWPDVIPQAARNGLRPPAGRQSVRLLGRLVGGQRRNIVEQDVQVAGWPAGLPEGADAMVSRGRGGRGCMRGRESARGTRGLEEGQRTSTALPPSCA